MVPAEKRAFFLCCLPPVGQQHRLRQQGSSAIIYFLVKVKKLSQPPQVPDTLKWMPAALTCTKKINDCPEVVLKSIFYTGQSFIFFAPLQVSATLQHGVIIFKPSPEIYNRLYMPGQGRHGQQHPAAVHHIIRGT